MKKLLVFVCIACHSIAFAQWNLVPSGTTKKLRDVHFPTNTIGYIVGDSGMVLKTTNAGASWTTVHSNSVIGSCNSVFFTSADTGYIASGDLYKTVNGGATWTLAIDAPDDQIWEVYFVNKNLGFASGTQLYRTANAGSVWTGTTLGNIFSSIDFVNDSVGYFVGGTTMMEAKYRTTNGGLTYSLLGTNPTATILEDVHFLNDSTGYICGWYGGFLGKTTDRGNNWQFLGTAFTESCWSVHFIDQNTGYYIENGGGSYKIYGTTNGGAVWNVQLQLSGSNDYLHTFHFIDPLNAVAVGDKGKIYRTTNGGGIGLKENSLQQFFKVSPNPFSNEAVIQSSEVLTNASLILYNTLGQAVKELHHLSGQSITLQRDQLPPGIYFMNVLNDGKVLIGKLVISDPK